VKTSHSPQTAFVVGGGGGAGSIASCGDPDEREVTYWIGWPHWGKGIATSALNGLWR
jgi:RimJ/RimL family protein N-acetyltransferase